MSQERMGMKMKKRVLLLLLLSLLKCRGEYPTSASSSGKEKDGFEFDVMLRSILVGSVTGLGCAVVCACLVRLVLTCCIKRGPLLKGPVVFSPQVSPKSLHSALASSSSLQLIGGNYYKLDNNQGFPIALKKFQIQLQIGKQQQRRMQRELQLLAGLRHRHLMSLRAYYLVGGFCLVYDYVPTGSLEDAMRNQHQLIRWDARLRIAVGIIKGLEYLHFACNPPILHRNLKPSNVLLDPDFEPRLGDYFIHTIIDHGIFRASSHYAPPECCSSSSSTYTEKSDIFSFGVILGMLLTGRDPSDPLFVQVTNGSSSSGGGGGAGGMGLWFRQLVEAGDAREALDKRLLGEETEEDEMLMAIRIAAVCLSVMPADRPSSDELVPMLTQLHRF